MKFEVSHSNQDNVEFSSEVIVNGKIEIGDYTYQSNWIVANCRYDVLLGMPWHRKENPKVDYKNLEVTVGKNVFKAVLDVPERLQITNIGVKEFKSILRSTKQGRNLELFKLVPLIGNVEVEEESSELRAGNERFDSLIRSHEDIFRTELPTGLP